jgi:hypothetical protein
VDPHIESARTPRHDATHSTHPKDAQPFARDLRAHHERWAPVFPEPLSHQFLALPGTASRTDHQHHREFGGRIGQHVRRVGHHDAPGACRAHIDVVVPDREVGNDPDLRRQALEDPRGEMLRVTRKDRVGAARVFDELVVRVEPIVRIQARVVIATQTSLHGIGKLAGDEDGWL